MSEWRAYRKVEPTEAKKINNPDDLDDVEGAWPALGREDIFCVHTPHGMADADYGDYLARDANGRLYPIKARVFDDTYEPVNGGPDDGA